MYNRRRQIVDDAELTVKIDRINRFLISGVTLVRKLLHSHPATNDRVLIS